MESKKHRDEVWERNKPYMDKKDIKETAEDLIPICERCEEWMGEEHDYEQCRNCPAMELWLSNEYLEWCAGWANDEMGGAYR